MLYAGVSHYDDDIVQYNNPRTTPSTPATCVNTLPYVAATGSVHDAYLYMALPESTPLVQMRSLSTVLQVSGATGALVE